MCVHKSLLLFEPLDIQRQPLALRYLDCPSFVLRYHVYRAWPRYRQIYLYSYVILHPRDLVKCLQAHWCNLTEWAQNIYPAMWIGNSRSWSLASTASFRYPKLSPLLSRYISHAIWCDQPHIPEAQIWYDLTVKGMNTMFLYFRYVHQIIHLMIWLHCQLTLLSMISKPWSSVAQRTS